MRAYRESIRKYSNLAADQIEIFESAWTMDHSYPLTEPMDGSILESWTMLAALGEATERLPAW